MPDGEVFSASSSSGQGACTGGPDGGAGQSGIDPLGLPPAGPAAAAGPAGEGGAPERREGPGHADGGAEGGSDWGGLAGGRSARDGGCTPGTVRSASSRSGDGTGPDGLVPLSWLHQVLAGSSDG